MKKDITFHQVHEVALAVTRQQNELQQPEWHVRIINNNPFPIENVLITSKGYGQKEGVEQKTSTLRHLIEVVEAKSGAIVEPIDPSVFHLTNEYWVSYYIDRQIYDKKFLFVPDSIREDNLSLIETLAMEGVLHP